MSAKNLISSVAMSDPAAAASSTAVPQRASLSAVAILGSAALFAVAPAVIHLTARDINPFYFSFVLATTRVSLGILFLAWSRKKCLDEFFQRPSTEDNAAATVARPLKLTSAASHLRYLSRSADSGGQTRASIQLAGFRSPVGWLKAPMLWAAAGALNYSFLVWSTHFVETAVATTAFELWPMFAIVGLARYERSEALYLDPSADPLTGTTSMSAEQTMLCVLAAVGLLFMLGGQAGTEISSLGVLFSFSGVVGISLALIGAALAAMIVVGTLVYGKVMYYSLVHEADDENARSLEPAASRSPEDRRLLLWLTMFGFTISGGVSLPVIGGLGLGLQNSHAGISALGLFGAVLLGIVTISASLLLRVGNVGTAGPAVNALLFVSPALALAVLLWLGVTLPRFDLFVIGAALAIAVNILLQLKPDKERDLYKFGKEALPDTRLGFVVFILSIWMFGTAVYLRDEIIPDGWMSWSANDYWGLIALPATVFALILAFRVARLTTRISGEDDIILRASRDCEHLVSKGLLTAQTAKKLCGLVTSQPKQLLSSRNSLRTIIRGAYRDAKTTEDEQLLLSLEKQIDQLTRSKQQGRDIVELLSLAAFAAVTVGLGLLARPGGLDSPKAGWSGFLSEVFILLFVTTVAFLCVNLFDIRRERQIPLLVSAEQHDGDHALFFRHKQNLRIQHAASVFISAAMCATFCVLLYDKWL